MGSYTTNYKLLKIGDGSVDPNNDDYVDATSQINKNLLAIDDFGKRVTTYKFLDATESDSLPKAGNVPGDKLFSNFTQTAYVWDGNSWVETASEKTTYKSLVLSAGVQEYTTGPAPGDYHVGYMEERKKVYLRGVICKPANAIWAQGVTVPIFAAGSLPLPETTYSGVTIGGFSTSRASQFYHWVARVDGSLTITKYGPNAQTAGSSENYVSLESIYYAIS